MEQVVLVNIISDNTGRTIRSIFRITYVLQDSLPAISAPPLCWMISSCHFPSSSQACQQIYISHNFPPKLACNLFPSSIICLLCALNEACRCPCVAASLPLCSNSNFIGIRSTQEVRQVKNHCFFFYSDSVLLDCVSVSGSGGFVGPNADEIIDNNNQNEAFRWRWAVGEPCDWRVQSI